MCIHLKLQSKGKRPQYGSVNYLLYCSVLQVLTTYTHTIITIYLFSILPWIWQVFSSIVSHHLLHSFVISCSEVYSPEINFVTSSYVFHRHPLQFVLSMQISLHFVAHLSSPIHIAYHTNVVAFLCTTSDKVEWPFYFSYLFFMLVLW